MTDPAWHYLTATQRTTIPRRHVFLAADGQQVRERGVFVQRWGAGVAIYRHAPKDRGAKETRRGYDTPAALWGDVDMWAKARNRTVLWSWDLSAVLRITDAFHILPGLGWDIGAWSVQPRGTWMVWHNGDRSLTMVEVQSFFPVDWPTMAANFLSQRTAELWHHEAHDPIERRVADTGETVRNAVVRYLDWLATEQLGDWQMTGTGQGFAAFRHKFLTDKMLVHWDEDARAAERRAMWAGRTEAMWHGTIRGSEVQEWDMTQAYPRIAERDLVPTELLRHLRPGENVWRWVDDPDYAVLAECRVHTDVPLVPTQREGRILWPVGEFDTTLWCPELRLVRDFGGQINVTRAWLYRATPALKQWATWIGEKLDNRKGDTPAWQIPIARHWSRAVIGRLGMQHATWEYIGDMPRVGIKWWTQKDMQTGEVSDLVHVGRQLWESSGQVDWSLSIIAVPSWIASRCREILTRIWLAAGEKRVLYVDTDSLLVEARHGHILATVARKNPQWGLRLKRAWRKVTIYGPRQIITGDRIRVSGVPVQAALLADGTLTGEVRESLRRAIQTGRVGQVRTVPRRWSLRAIDRRRDVGDDGWTEAIRLTD